MLEIDSVVVVAAAAHTLVLVPLRMTLGSPVGFEPDLKDRIVSVKSVCDHSHHTVVVVLGETADKTTGYQRIAAVL